MPAPIPAPPSDVVVFGGTGNPAARRLLPILCLRHRDGLLPKGTRVIAVSGATLDDVDYRVAALGSLRRELPTGTWQPEQVRAFVGTLHHVSLDATRDAADWHDLAVALPDPNRPRVFHLACAPTLFTPIEAGLRRAGLLTEQSRIASAVSDRARIEAYVR